MGAVNRRAFFEIDCKGFTMAMEHCGTITEARGLLDFYRHFANATGKIIKVADGYLVMAFWGTR